MSAARQVLAFVAGLAVPPLLTALIFQPYFIQSRFDEIDSIKYDMDYVGWHIRLLEEKKGITGDALYVPTSYYQGRY